MAATLAGCLAALSACETEDTVVAGDVGSLVIATVTAGEDPDEDGYSVLFDTGTTLDLLSTGTLTVLSVPAGERSLELQDVADNCEVADPNPRTVTVGVDEASEVEFTVTCYGPGGTVVVTVATTGDSLDADGYVAVLEADSQTVAVDDSIAFTDVRPGARTVELAGVATNCSVTGGVTRTVDVPSEGEVLAAFEVVCTASSSSSSFPVATLAPTAPNVPLASQVPEWLTRPSSRRSSTATSRPTSSIATTM